MVTNKSRENKFPLNRLHRKAQGLPLHFIVIAAIAALVLVLVIAFTIGGLGAFFTKIFGAGKVTVGEELDVVRTTCTGLCDTAKGSITTTAFEASSYCYREFDIDLDGNGELGGYTEIGTPAEEAGIGANLWWNSIGEQEVNINCWDIDVDCTTTIAGQTCTATSADEAACACEIEVVAED